MGHEFIPTLIQTVTYEAYNWNELRFAVPDKVLEMAEEEDVEGIYNLIKDEFEEYEKEKVKEAIKDFTQDIQGAGGVVAIRNKVYQEVIIEIINC